VRTAADKYDVDKLVALCEAYLVIQATGGRSLTQQQFQALFNLAELCDLGNLEKACVVFLLRWKNWLATHWNYPCFLSHSQCQKVLLYDVKPVDVAVTSPVENQLPWTDMDDYWWPRG